MKVKEKLAKAFKDEKAYLAGFQQGRDMTALLAYEMMTLSDCLGGDFGLCLKILKEVGEQIQKKEPRNSPKKPARDLKQTPS